MSLQPGPEPLFSIAIPLFNHEAFVGATVGSVLAQDEGSFEILVSDNASTDRSVDVVTRLADPRIVIARNPVNIGFAPNLDRAVALGSAPRVILVSSDDLMGPGALSTYRRMVDALGTEAAERAVVTSPLALIDEEGEPIDVEEQPAPIASLGAVDEALSRAAGVPVRRIPAAALLASAMRSMRNPLPFASTCYPRALWEQTGGYLGTRIQNPDKWFHWRLLGVASEVVYVDAPLFQYRVHRLNREKARTNAQSMKHLMDEYVTMLEASDTLLESAGMTRRELRAAFLREDVAKRSMVFAATGQGLTARRYLRMGASVIGSERWRDSWWWRARAVVALGPLAPAILGKRAGASISASPFHSDL